MFNFLKAGSYFSNKLSSPEKNTALVFANALPLLIAGPSAAALAWIQIAQISTEWNEESIKVTIYNQSLTPIIETGTDPETVGSQKAPPRSKAPAKKEMKMWRKMSLKKSILNTRDLNLISPSLSFLFFLPFPPPRPPLFSLISKTGEKLPKIPNPSYLTRRRLQYGTPSS